LVGKAVFDLVVSLRAEASLSREASLSGEASLGVEEGLGVEAGLGVEEGWVIEHASLKMRPRWTVSDGDGVGRQEGMADTCRGR
jgi:hypothetical protein